LSLFTAGLSHNFTMPINSHSGDSDIGQPPESSARNHGVAAMTFEQARDELMFVVGRLETGGEPLEETVALWERGEALAARCQQWLDGVQERLQALTDQTAPAGESAEF
jgi:exodeoxyribonuclease VII small subunit